MTFPGGGHWEFGEARLSARAGAERTKVVGEAGATTNELIRRRGPQGERGQRPISIQSECNAKVNMIPFHVAHQRVWRLFW